MYNKKRVDRSKFQIAANTAAFSNTPLRKTNEGNYYIMYSDYIEHYDPDKYDSRYFWYWREHINESPIKSIADLEKWDFPTVFGFIGVIIIVVLVCVAGYYITGIDRASAKQKAAIAQSQTSPAYWSDNPEIEFTIYLNHNGYTSAKVLHLSANMFNYTNTPVTNKTIDDATIELLNKRRAEINDSVKTEFTKIHTTGNCQDEVIDGISYFTCQIN